MITERILTGANGLVAFLILLVADIATGAILVRAALAERVPVVVGAALALAFLTFCMRGLFIVNPNEAKVAQLFGSYAGTFRTEGLRWANPFYLRRTVSLRVRNFETNSRLKVNDVEGNPIEISAVVVWKVTDAAQALFEVQDYPQFVQLMAEAAIRKLAMSYPYDTHEEGQISLRGNPVEVSEHLRQEVQERLARAGVQVIEARISNLAYAAEIAQAMLRRQQATAVIAARQKIVEGSVGMVEMALARLSRNHVVNLDEERKAAMVSNLLVVLCSESAIQPVLNTGTLYT